MTIFSSSHNSIFTSGTSNPSVFGAVWLKRHTIWTSEQFPPHLDNAICTSLITITREPSHYTIAASRDADCLCKAADNNFNAVIIDRRRQRKVRPSTAIEPVLDLRIHIFLEIGLHQQEAV